MKGFVAGLVASFLPQAANALYEDQAGSFDWLQSNLGQVKLYTQSPSAKGAAYLATKSNVIASIKLKSGTTNRVLCVYVFDVLVRLCVCVCVCMCVCVCV